jgi:hypothetical protein
MKDNQLRPARPGEQRGGRSRLTWFLAAGCALALLIGLLRTLRTNDGETARPFAQPASSRLDAGPPPAARDRFVARPPRSGVIPDMTPPPEVVVSNKLSQFARHRREVVHAMARHFNVPVTDEVERFFAAAAAGQWDELTALFAAMKARQQSDAPSEELGRLFPAILETYGVAEIAREWPAQQLLDYGQAVLGALRPGMVYVGGTDPGRFIPTLLNETAEGERHVVLTQNAFADGRYLDYVNFLYDDRLAALTKDDSQRAFSDYLADAQRRLLHDQQFPDQPRQVRPGEDIQIRDNRVQVSGQVAVMSINERLLQTLLQKNPDVPFALEESFSLKSTYAGTAPLGPVLELRAEDARQPLAAERAAQALDYWRATTQTLLADPAARPDSDARKAYAHMAAAQANLFAGHNLRAEAEQGYRLARELAPHYLDPAGQLARLLVDSGRQAEAVRLLDDFARAHADQRPAVESLRQSLFPPNAPSTAVAP